MSIFSNKSLKQKFFMLSVIGGVFVVAMTSVNLFLVSSMKTSFDGMSKNELAFRENIAFASYNLSEARKHEIKIYADVDMHDADELHEHIGNVDRYMDKVIKIVDSGDSGEIVKYKETSHKLHDTIAEYKNEIEESLVFIKKLGTSETGLYGDLRKNAHDTEDLIKNSSRKFEYMTAYLTLKRHEKDFIMRHDPKYAKKWNETYLEFSNLLKKNNNSEILNKLIGYKALFDQIEVGFIRVAEIKKKHVDLIDEGVQQVTTKLLDDSFKSMSQVMAASSNKMIWSFIFATATTFTFILVGFFVYTKIGTILINPISTIIVKLKNSNVRSHSVADDLAKHSEDLSSAASEQAAAIQESVSAIEEMSSMISHSTQSSHESSQGIDQINEDATHGAKVMSELKESMESIGQSNVELANMVKIINEITLKTNVINDIVFKTQLLSFNASIEAARAGQHGKGFAVVAEEVGKLAQMSGDAALEIRKLLDASQSQVHHIVDINKTRVDTGKEVTSKALETFEHIITSIQDISVKIKSIAEAAKEQELGVQQTNTAMGELDVSAQNNNEISIKVAKLAEDMSHTSHEMGDIVDELNHMFFANEQTSKNNVVSITPNKSGDVKKAA